MRHALTRGTVVAGGERGRSARFVRGRRAVGVVAALAIGAVAVPAVAITAGSGEEAAQGGDRAASGHPYCVEGRYVDPDGDGWGWMDDSVSCVVRGGPADRPGDGGGDRPAPDPAPDPAPGGGTVLTVPGRTVTMPGGTQLAGELMDRHDLPPRNEYYLDYEATFHEGFHFDCGGKLPGLGGGSVTTGCDPIEADGWTARFMWRPQGQGVVYAYHQDRQNDCGDDVDFRGAAPHFEAGSTHRITQYVRVNDPGQRNGVVRVWLDGDLVLERTDIAWRGTVAESVAQVDSLVIACFHGGCWSRDFPPRQTSVTFSDFHVTTCRPDTSGAVGSCT